MIPPVKADLLGFVSPTKMKVVDNWLNQFVSASSNRFETVRNKVFIMCVFLSATLGAPSLLPYGSWGKIFYGMHVAMALLLVFYPKGIRTLPGLKMGFSTFILLESAVFFIVSDKAMAATVFWAPAVIAMFTIFHGNRKALIPCALYICEFIACGFYMSRQEGFQFADYMSKDQMASILVSILSSQVFLAAVILTFERAKVRVEKDLKVEYEKRLEARRMSFVRELIGNVAHEINNPLAIIQASVIRLERSGYMRGTMEYMDLIRNIEEAVLRVCSVRDGLGHFAVGDTKEKLEAIDVRALFKKVIHQSRSNKSNTRLVFSDRSQGLQILCRQRQIGTALNALIVNACQATDGDENGRILVEAYLERQNLCFRVTDNGRGIPEDVRDKIFLPFFSTRAHIGNKGLGLSVSRGTIAEHGGHIDFENQPGKTRFTIRLPLNLSNQVNSLQERRLS